jgi:hypothetical protein
MSKPASVSVFSAVSLALSVFLPMQVKLNDNIKKITGWPVNIVVYLPPSGYPGQYLTYVPTVFASGGLYTPDYPSFTSPHVMAAVIALGTAIGVSILVNFYLGFRLYSKRADYVSLS